ncbi:hypothetical protein HDZ31DRAFT_83375 [Schizophyllum fasciatum]
MVHPAGIASSSSAPALKRSKSFSKIPTSGSVGSIESRFSSPHSHGRLRTVTVSAAQLYRKVDPAPEATTRPETPTGKRHLLPVFFTRKSSEVEPSHPRPMANPCLRWLLVAYSIWCCLYASASLFGEYRHDSLHTLRHRTLNELSNTQRLSRIVPHQPPLAALQPNILDAQHAPAHAITACLWTTDTDAAATVRSWTSIWPGPISAVIATSSAPGSPEHASLVRRLRAADPGKLRRLWLHLVHDSGGSPSSNAYLNTARLFAPTKNVVLFPANITTSPVHISLLHDRMQDRPILLTPRAPSSFPPFSPAPVALPRDYPVWCSERFFFGGDRLADWKECLWHIWLNQFGDVDFLNVTSVAPLVKGISPADRKIRSRLVSRFRTETCDLFAKQHIIREDEGVRTDPAKQRWLIHFCEKTSDSVITSW